MPIYAKAALFWLVVIAGSLVAYSGLNLDRRMACAGSEAPLRGIGISRDTFHCKYGPWSKEFWRPIQ
jgi:hypothetical protein